MNGHELLRKVKAMHPATIRLILSGYADEREITRALLDGSCKTYILKPWDNQNLIKTIRQLLEIRKVLREKKLLTIINSVDGMCSPPRIFHKLTDLIDKDADMQQIAAVIEEDPVLTTKVLHMANSSFYGRKTGSITQAIVYLGLTAVKSIVLSTTLCELLPDRGWGIFDKEFLWRHASMTNQFVTRLYKQITGNNIPPVAASVGLLSDLGRMALVNQLPEKYRQIASVLQVNPDLLLDDIECEIIGVSHQEVSGYLLDWWGLPQPIIESALFHHDPFHDMVSDRILVAVVHIASHFALKALNPRFAHPLDERIFTLFDLEPEACEHWLTEPQT